MTISQKLSAQPLIRYVLTPPNLEVKYSLANYILDYLVLDYRAKDNNRIGIYKALDNRDLSELKRIIQSFFASIPNDWYRKNDLSDYEGYYASIFYCYFAACGLDVRAEDSTNQGRIDMTLMYKDRVYIFEFKVVELLPKGKAIEQIRNKKYHEKYAEQAREIYLIGVEFSKEERNLVAFDVESVPDRPSCKKL